MSRGAVSVIRDPAIAAAAGKCWLARWNGGKGATRMVGISVNSFHPQDCGFCEYPVERLVQSIDEFVKWAGLKPPEAMDEIGVIRESVEMFLTQPAHEQARLVAKAQGYYEDDEG